MLCDSKPHLLLIEKHQVVPFLYFFRINLWELYIINGNPYTHIDH